jgi:predicted NAD/FAD-binding protein
VLENGVLEFPTVFRNFLALMQELGVELEPVTAGSALFLKDDRRFLSGGMIQKNCTGIQSFIDQLRLNTLYASSASFWLRMQGSRPKDFYNQPLSQLLQQPSIRNCWLKLLMMYSYSTPFEQLSNFPAELAIPVLKDYVFVSWVRIKGGVYSYIEQILHRFKGKVWLNVEPLTLSRTANAIALKLPDGTTQQFDKVVVATPPDQVLQLLADPTIEERKRFSAWKPNRATTLLHTDTSPYRRYRIQHPSEFDFFQTDRSWGYNAYLNQLCGIASPTPYSLAFNLESLIAKDKILHIQEHHTPHYTVEAFQYRDEIIATNGENHTYHAGAYLSDGLHEGAIVSARRVAQLMK